MIFIRLLFISLLSGFITSCSFKPQAKFDVTGNQASLLKDEAPHVKNSLEWWYFTGHLQNDSGRDYGLEYVFFHFNPFGKNDYMMVNFAVTDPTDSSFYYDYEIVRRKDLLIDELPLDFRVSKKDNDWLLKGQKGRYELSATMTGKKEVAIDLKTQPSKPMLLHRGTGYEKYGEYAEAGYYSYPRLSTSGTLRINGVEEEVSGELWYDRQWNCIGVWEKDIAWDWISIQLEEEKEEIMVYNLHHIKDSVRLVGGTCFSEELENTYLTPEDLTIQPLEFWKSPDSKNTYPVKWKVSIPCKGYELMIEAVIPDQELKLKVGPFTKLYYWEGMCNVAGTKYGKPVSGRSYVEITNR